RQHAERSAPRRTHDQGRDGEPAGRRRRGTRPGHGTPVRGRAVAYASLVVARGIGPPPIPGSGPTSPDRSRWLPTGISDRRRDWSLRLLAGPDRARRVATR